MRAIIQSLRRDHLEIEELLRILEQECELFRQAERPDYELLGETVDYFQSFLSQVYYPKENILLDLTRMRNAECAGLVDDLAAERAAATSCLRDLQQALRDVLNEQRVLRQSFDDAARGFIQHQRRQVAMEQQLLSAARSVLAPADWTDLNARLRDRKASLRSQRIEERLRAEQHRIVEKSMADQAERGEPEQTL